MSVLLGYLEEKDRTIASKDKEMKVCLNDLEEKNKSSLHDLEEKNKYLEQNVQEKNEAIKEMYF